MVAISEAAQANAVYFGHFIQVCASLTPRNIVQLDQKQQQHPLSNENQQAMKYITCFHLNIFVIKNVIELEIKLILLDFAGKSLLSI